MFDTNKQRFPAKMIILGEDFNSPGVDWVSGSLVDSYVTANFRKSLITLAHNSMLEQIVTQPTIGEIIFWIYVLLPTVTTLSSAQQCLALVTTMQLL